MERKPPGEEFEPETVNDAPDDARGFNATGWTVAQVVMLVIGGLMLATGCAWVGSLVGLIAEILPGGQSATAAAAWGAVGAIGLALVLAALAQVRRARRPVK